MKILHIKKTVKKVLTEQPETRDNDNLLLFSVWNEYDSNIIFYASLKKMVLTNKLPHFESIRRNRQWLQAKHPELRGSKYKIRKTVYKNETEEDLGYKKTPRDAPKYLNYG